jgi:NitT/TauT family transport system permease protein
MIRKPIAPGWHVALGVASFVTLGALYTTLSAVVHAEQPNNKTIPTWRQMYEEGFRPAFVPRAETLPYSEWDAARGQLVWGERRVVHPPLVWVDGRATLARLFAALGLAVLIAVPLGLLMGCYQAVEAYFVPPLSFLAKIAPTAMIAVFMTVTTTVFQFYVAIITFGLIPILAQTVFHAAKEDVPEELLFKARTLGATQVECIWDVIFKYILPKVMEAVRLQIGPAIVYLMAAEWARGEVGFGCRMRLLQKSLDMSIIYTYLLTLGLFGLLADRVFIWLQRKLCPWYGGE